MSEDKHISIINAIERNFRCFGGGRGFAAGVDVKEVVEFILKELKYDALVKQRDALLKACRYTLIVHYPHSDMIRSPHAKLCKKILKAAIDQCKEQSDG